MGSHISLQKENPLARRRERAEEKEGRH